MENNQEQIPSQQPVIQSPEPQSPRKSNTLLMGVGAIFLVGLGLLAGFLLFGNKNKPSTSNIQSVTQVTPTETVIPINSAAEEITYITDTFPIKKTSAVNGNETIDVNLDIPSTFNVKKGTGNCPSYILGNLDGTFTLTVTPICGDWAATYKTWPADTFVLNEENNVGNDGHTAYLVRFVQSSQYRYAEGEKSTTNKVMDAMLLRYGTKGGFIPTTVSFTFTGPKEGEAQALQIADKVVSSIKAQ